MRELRLVEVTTGPAVPGLLAELGAALNGSGPALLPTLPGTRPLAAPAILTPPLDEPTDPTVAVLATSGSQGRRRGVLLQASALLASASATHDRLGGPGQWLLALPVHHVAGLQVLVRSLVSRTRPAVVDLTDSFTAGGFAAAAAAMSGARRYTALVPTQLARLLDAGPAVRRELATFDAVLVGGAALPEALRTRARDEGVRLVASYGMTETCGGCVYDGRPLDGVRVWLDPDGRIHLSGPVLARGYLPAGSVPGRPGEPPASPQVPGGFVALDGFGVGPDGERRLRTDDAGSWQVPPSSTAGPVARGDLGRVATADADGPRLRVHGRLDDAVITGGVTVSPAAVEEVLLSLDSVGEAVVVAVPDADWGRRLVAAVVTRPGIAAPSLEEVRRVVSERIEPAAAPRRLMVMAELPLRGPGKPDRAALTRLAADG